VNEDTPARRGAAAGLLAGAAAQERRTVTAAGFEIEVIGDLKASRWTWPRPASRTAWRS
jgi:hypothetical protein